MNARVYNVCMLIGWLMLLAGGVMVHPGYGLAISGVVLMGLTMLSVYLSAPEKAAD